MVWALGLLQDHRDFEILGFCVVCLTFFVVLLVTSFHLMFTQFNNNDLNEYQAKREVRESRELENSSILFVFFQVSYKH